MNKELHVDIELNGAPKSAALKDFLVRTEWSVHDLSSRIAQELKLNLSRDQYISLVLQSGQELPENAMLSAIPLNENARIRAKLVRLVD